MIDRSVFPGPIRQIGFIVASLEEAVAQWAALGVAPWLVVRDLKMEGCRYRGEHSAPVISLALANSGELQIELIEQRDETPSIYKEFLDATGGGFNQVAYWMDDVAAVRDAAVAAGWTEVWCNDDDKDPGVRFSYVEHPNAPMAIVELMELTESNAPMNEMLRQAAESWTPGDPIYLG